MLAEMTRRLLDWERRELYRACPLRGRHESTLSFARGHIVHRPIRGGPKLDGQVDRRVPIPMIAAFVIPNTARPIDPQALLPSLPASC